MRRIPSIPCRVHVFVCANTRDPGGLPSCKETGAELFRTLKEYVLSKGLARSVWVTQSACLGYCHRRGATVSIYTPKDDKAPTFFQAVQPSDFPTLVQTIEQALQGS